jgi:hypothetical protein
MEVECVQAWILYENSTTYSEELPIDLGNCRPKEKPPGH